MTDTDTDTNVDELEAQVEEQQQMIEELCTKLVELSQLLPEHDRRQFLKAGAGAGALLGSGLLGRASAQADDGDTTWGSDTDRDDVYRDLVDAKLVRTDVINIKDDQALLSRPASGSVQLSSGTAVVDTGLSDTDATFYLSLGVDDPGADTKISGRLFWDDSAGTYKIELVETETSVGNPTVNYDILRVR